MKAYLGITDRHWFELLARAQGGLIPGVAPTDIDEVNFWQPSARGGFSAVPVGAPFLFKLHRPHADGRDVVAGGGYFWHHSRLPVSVAWESFGIKNGAETLEQMRARVAKYRREPTQHFADPQIGCIMLIEPFFLPPKAWVDIPHWRGPTQRGKTYDLDVTPGRSIWMQVTGALRALGRDEPEPVMVGEDRYAPALVKRRIGQGTFRGLVTDAYGRACAVTRSKALPALQAAHIVPYSEGGGHEVANGLLLRSDVHRLFDLGYMTVTPEHRFEVSSRLRSDFHNGEEYLAMRGSKVWVPEDERARPDTRNLEWHNESRFVA